MKYQRGCVVQPRFSFAPKQEEKMAKTIKGFFPLKGASEGKVSPTFETDGYVGEDCRTATEAFEKALGSGEEVEVKPEMYETEERREFLTEGD